MGLKTLFFNEEAESTSARVIKRRKKKDEVNSYGKLLSLNKSFKFELVRKTATTEDEFNEVVEGAVKLLKQDLERFGERFELIPASLRNKLSGNIGSMTIIVDDDNKVSVRFHKRDGDFIWDDESKKFPEKETTGKYKYEIFFDLDWDEE